MSFTNKTPNYDLPQYVATDKPTYLVDANGAYLAIDTAMKANETAAATAQSTADTNTAAISTLNTQINGENGLAADLTAVETLAATTAGSVNTINSLIGNGEPTTTDKTLIGAINEINADLNGDGAIADKVDALETKVGTATLETTATDLSGAVNELHNTKARVATRYQGTSNSDTWEHKLNAIYSTLNALTSDEVAFSQITVGNDSYQHMYSGSYVNVHADASTLGVAVLNIAETGSTCISILITTSDVTITDNTANNTSAVLNLKTITK